MRICFKDTVLQLILMQRKDIDQMQRESAQQSQSEPSLQSAEQSQSEPSLQSAQQSQSEPSLQSAQQSQSEPQLQSAQQSQSDPQLAHETNQKNQEAQLIDQPSTSKPPLNHKTDISKSDLPTQQQIMQDDQELPDHFYDSDIASVNEQDFLSDNEPPKDTVFQRKLLCKQKLLHIHKTIIKVGNNLDKPAPYDQITLKFKQLPTQFLQQRQSLKTLLQSQQQITYNLGMRNEQIEKLVISMKKQEISLFQLEFLEVSKKSNIKILKQRRVYIVQVLHWTTVIDMDGDLRILKYVLCNGKGPNRVEKFDQVTFQYDVKINDVVVEEKKYTDLRIEEEELSNFDSRIWRILSSMKKGEVVSVKLRDQTMRRSCENNLYENYLKIYHEKQQQYPKDGKSEVLICLVNIKVDNIVKIDDIYSDGSILKKTLIKGVSTAKPDSGSFIYYALKFYDDARNLLQIDKFFDSDWWEDYSKLEQLGCRKTYLDEYKVSKLLKATMKRMKPAQISEIQCRDMSLFTYGADYEQLQQLWPKSKQFPPKKIYLQVRVYNFTEAYNCFNMDIAQKVSESRRKKVTAVNLLNEGNIKKAYKRFQNIVSFYGSGEINQQGYDEKISALMNSILCLLKQQKYTEMLPLCNMVLESPKHGYDQEKMKIKGPNIDNDHNDNEVEDRQAADLSQNPKIIDKCLYRKSLALVKTGQNSQALQCLSKISVQSQEITKLKKQATESLEKYNKKSKKMFKNMFAE